VEAARRQSKTAIGYRLAAEAHSAEKAYGVHLNPDKAEKIALGKGDKVILLAED